MKKSAKIAIIVIFVFGIALLVYLYKEGKIFCKNNSEDSQISQINQDSDNQNSNLNQTATPTESVTNTQDDQNNGDNNTDSFKTDTSIKDNSSKSTNKDYNDISVDIYYQKDKILGTLYVKYPDSVSVKKVIEEPPDCTPNEPCPGYNTYFQHLTFNYKGSTFNIGTFVSFGAFTYEYKYIKNCPEIKPGVYYIDVDCIDPNIKYRFIAETEAAVAKVFKDNDICGPDTDDPNGCIVELDEGFVWQYDDSILTRITYKDGITKDERKQVRDVFIQIAKNLEYKKR